MGKEQESVEDSAAVRIEKWLRAHNLFLPKLKGVLVSEGVSEPVEDLSILHEPELRELAQSAQLTIFQRRKFLNAVQSKQTPTPQTQRKDDESPERVSKAKTVETMVPETPITLKKKKKSKTRSADKSDR